MFNVGTGEMIMIAVVALLVLVPQRLPELARRIGKFLREFRRQTDDVRNVVEREFYRMDQEIMNPPTPVQPPDAVAQGEQPQPAAQLPTPEEPKQEELALQPPPVDESDPGHPDHFREEKPAEEQKAAEPAPPTQKVG